MAAYRKPITSRKSKIQVDATNVIKRGRGRPPKLHKICTGNVEKIKFRFPLPKKRTSVPGPPECPSKVQDNEPTTTNGIKRSRGRPGRSRKMLNRAAVPDYVPLVKITESYRPSEKPTPPIVCPHNENQPMPVLVPEGPEPEKVNSAAKKPQNGQNPRCVFCRRSEINETKYGPMFRKERKKISAHFFCLVFSDNLQSSHNDPHEGFLGFKVGNVRDQIKIAKEKVCDYCHKIGATVTCNYPGCHTVYHFPCGTSRNVKMRFMSQYATICDKHGEVEVERMNNVNPFWHFTTETRDFSAFFSVLKKLVDTAGVKKRNVQTVTNKEEARKLDLVKYLELKRSPFHFEFVNVECDEKQLKNFQNEEEAVDPFSFNRAMNIKEEISEDTGLNSDLPSSTDSDVDVEPSRHTQSSSQLMDDICPMSPQMPVLVPETSLSLSMPDGDTEIDLSMPVLVNQAIALVNIEIDVESEIPEPAKSLSNSREVEILSSLPQPSPSGSGSHSPILPESEEKEIEAAGSNILEIRNNIQVSDIELFTPPQVPDDVNQYHYQSLQSIRATMVVEINGEKYYSRNGRIQRNSLIPRVPIKPLIYSNFGVAELR